MLVTNVTASLPWKGTTLEVVLEENRGPVVDEKRVILIGSTNVAPQVIPFKMPELLPPAKSPPPLPLGLRRKE